MLDAIGEYTQGCKLVSSLFYERACTIKALLRYPPWQLPSILKLSLLQSPSCKGCPSRAGIVYLKKTQRNSRILFNIRAILSFLVGLRPEGELMISESAGCVTAEPVLPKLGPREAIL